MKIINNVKDTEVRFENLVNGEVFEWAGDFYIKTPNNGVAVRLDDGVTDEFAHDVLVRPVVAILTVS